MAALIIMLILLGVIYHAAKSVSSGSSSNNRGNYVPPPAPAPRPAPAPEIPKYDKDFFDLCSKGTAEAVQAAIPSLKDAHERDNNSNTNLVLNIGLIGAARNNGDEGVCKVLIDAGADVKFKTVPDSETALHLAFANPSRNLKIIDVLIGAGSDVNARTHDGTTPLMIAAMAPFDNSRVIKALINAGADVEATHILGDQVSSSVTNALSYAIASNNAENVRAIIEAGADVNKRLNGKFKADGRLLDTYNYPLHDAVGQGTEILKLLLDAGAYVNAINGFGNTPLRSAQMSGNFEAARLLEARGATL